MTIAQFFGGVAIALTFIGYLPYIITLLRHKTKPHVFSWVIWSATTSIVFFAQLADSGGFGAWPIGISGLLTLFVAGLAVIRQVEIKISKLDWVFFVAALLSIPIWYLAADPFWAVILLTTIDMLGFGPTLRKAYAAPYDEDATFYIIFAIRNGFSIPALDNFSTATLLFPIATGVGCIALVALIFVRRRAMPQGQP